MFRLYKLDQKELEKCDNYNNGYAKNMAKLERERQIKGFGPTNPKLFHGTHT